MGPRLVARLDDLLMRPDQVARPFEIRWIGRGQFLEDRDSLVVAPGGLGASPSGGREIGPIVNEAGIRLAVGTGASFHGFCPFACQIHVLGKLAALSPLVS